ncbi:gliding motility-associated C-terminal domain-containing protein [Seonamhaeicola sp. MEBiC1930]|uniref:T9SS type B sorting domain-containing protein n=1 Tax=Seonamhaeicola sp. MEBiC01930 TaxID=2976768 RepID=UPI003255BE87
MKNLYSKASTKKYNVGNLIIASILFFGCINTVISQVRVPFTPRSAAATPTETIYNVKGDFTMIGNTNLTLVSYSDTSNNYGDMEYVDVDASAVPGNTTFNSSSATLTFSNENGAVAECSNILYAGLYWTGRAGNTDTFSVTKDGITKTLDKRKVNIKGPNSSGYTELTAGTSEIYYPSDTDGDMYSAYIEITDYVILNGLGEYFVADIATLEGDGGNIGYYGGWGMVVVYENSKMNWRDVTVFDGHAYVTSANTSHTIGISGFQAAQNGDVNIKLGVMAGEGDVSVSGDYLEILRQDNNSYERLSHSNNNTNNFFNSSIVTGGNTRDPNLPNNTGVDIAMFNIDNTGNGIIDNNQTSTTFRYGSTGDTYIIYNLTFSVDAYIPEPEGILTNTSINGNPPGPTNSSLEPDEDADYVIEIKNTGTEAIDDTVLTIPLPESVNASGLGIVTNTYTPFSTTNVPVYNPAIGVNGAIEWDLGTLPVPSDPDTVLADISFTLTVTTDCSILGDDNFEPTVELGGTLMGIGAISGVSFTADLIQGYETTGVCTGDPVPIPHIINIDYLDFVNEGPSISVPSPLNFEGCDENDITAITARYPFSLTESADIKSTFEATGYTVSDNGNISSITYIDVINNTSSCPFIVTRTYTVTDDCGNTETAEQIINVDDTTPPLIIGSLTDSDITGCSISDLPDAVTSVTELEALAGDLEISDTCTSDNNLDVNYSDSTSGSCPIVITRTYTVTDECDNTSLDVIHTINIAPTAITYNAPVDTDLESCNFADQSEVDTAFNDWVTAQTNAYNVANGCSPILSNNSASVSIPELCTGGSVTVTWTISDLCETIVETADFNLTAPTAITYNAPVDTDLESCNFADQSEVDTAFNDWVTAQTNAYNVANGCSPILSNNSASVSIPELCAGGSVTVTWTISDLCETIVETADFSLTAPTAITYNAPVDDASTAAEFDDPNPATAQANLDADLAAWIAAQNATINGSVANGCSPVVTNDYAGQTLTFCASGSITITWTITDLCETINNITATYTFTQPDGISFTNPSNKTVDTCDFDNDDPATAQTNLDADIATWVTDQTNIITNSLTGGSPAVTHDFTNQSIDLCTGGNITITWSIDDICENINASATYTVNPPTAITYNAPVDTDLESCDFADQNAVDTAFNDWVTAQTNAYNVANGCSPILSNNSASVSIPELCTGGSVTVTWTISDLCETIVETADFNLTAPTAITYNAPVDTDLESCDFADQNAVDTAFNDWVTAQTNAYNVANGCSPILSNNSASVSIPELCTGGSVTVTWTISDLCETIVETADFNLTAPTAITYNAPVDTDLESCNFADQNAVDTAFNDWVTAQTNAYNVANGCSPILSNNSASVSIPELCAGGSVTVTWTISDLCETIIETADFNLTAPTAITYNAPVDDASIAAEFDDPNPATAQANLDADLAAWIAAQNATINGSVANGCSPVVTNDYAGQTLTFCASGSITITWTITDLCETINNITATYTFTQPDGISFTNPSNKTVDTCDFDNDDPATAQTNLDADIATWVTDQTNIITNSLTGGSPAVTHDFTNQSIDLCTGGNITITWSIDDICENINASATYTVNPPTAITYNAPVDTDLESCDFADQNAVDTAFNDWVTAQTNAYNVANGCSPILSNNSASVSIPELCTGGSVTVTWTISDLCETIVETADFNLTAPTAITYNAPVDTDLESCDFADQNAVDTAFNDWVTAQTNAYNVANGCSPILSNNSASVSIPELCTGGSVTVTWTISDLCETIVETADFNLTAPTAITYNAPVDTDLESCNFADQNAVDTAFNDWVTAQTNAYNVANGCSPILSNDSASVSIPELCTGGSVTVTWTISDLCETIVETADFNLTAPTAITYNAPVDTDLESCNFADQSEVDSAFNDWVTAQTNAYSVANGCSPILSNDSASVSIPELCAGGSVTVTWTINDLCETIVETADFSLTAPTAITYNAPVDDASTAAEFDDPNPATAQANLDADLAAWIAAQNATINGSVANGCSPIITNDYAGQTLTFCNSGSITITWTITDLCETINNITATYTFTQPDGISFTNPSNKTVDTCDFDNDDPATAQTNLDADIATWVTDQTNIITNSLTGGSPAVTHDFTNQSIDLCTGGNITITWSIDDICENINASATYTVNPPTAITYNAPVDTDLESCDFADQNAVDTAFNDWVTAQTNAYNVANGCSPILSNNSASVSIPELCTGGSVTVTWTISDLCETIVETADFNLTAPTAITYNAPVDTDLESCDFADQNAVDTAFNDWVTAQTNAYNVANGCSPILSNNSASVSIPELCTGGSVTVTWTISDLCETIVETADFNLTAPTAITYNAPVDTDLESCNFADQNAVDTAFNDWVTAQTNAYNVANGCSPILSNDSASVSIPELCAGGSVTVTWTISDLCETIVETADFSLTAPTAITYNAPVDTDLESCNFADQSEVDSAFNDWVTAQTNAYSVANGCSPILSNDSASVSIPELCAGGSVTVTWTINDLCETIVKTADFSLTAPTAITYNAPVDDASTAAEFDDPNPATAQANLDADLAAWIAAQNATINGSVANGCSPIITNDYAGQTLTFCNSGSITITWTITDLCETINNITATYTFTQPDGISFTNPSNKTVDTCDFDNDDPATAQTNLDADIATWVTDQTNIITNSLTGGSPEVTHDFTNQSIDLCTGGNITITWSIDDICENIQASATYTVNPPTAITYNAPIDDSSDACEFNTSDLNTAQSELDADIAAWYSAQDGLLNGSVLGGCSPVITNDYSNESIDFCSGGSITITWTISDLCETYNLTSTYTFTEPTETVFDQATLPADTTVECDTVPDAVILTASNSCGAINVVFTENRTDGNCTNNYVLERNWVATNICGVITSYTQTVTVQDTTAPELTLPPNVSAECSDNLSPINFGEATALDNCDANPVITFNDVRTDGACEGTFTITRTWTATDECGNSISADQIITTSDTTAPEFDQVTLPANITVECDGVPDAVILTATDNCGDATVTVSDVRTDGNCPSNYTITRSYTATDDCGLTNTHVQVISVQDITAPEFVESLPVANLVVECDNVPDAEVLTATDNCGSASVTIVDVRTDGNCPSNYTIARTWTATDECGLTTTHTQIITVQDTTAPVFESVLPGDITVECDSIPDTETITATDNCGDAIVTTQDVRTDGDCPNNYIIARTWIATDECGLTTTHTQLITVQDTTAPTPTSTFEEVLDVSCTDIPDAPALTFEDNCSSNITTVFEETSTYEDGVYLDYVITRTWTVRDECNNEATYTQTLSVTLDEVVTDVVAPDWCFDEGVLNMNDFLPDGLNTDGTWEMIEGNTDATLTDNIFDPTTLELSFDFLPDDGGIDYRFVYTTTDSGCISITEVTMNIHADCVVLPCGQKDVVISKAITPNGDAYNENFVINGIELCGFEYAIKIFNRWGALIYESDDYQNDWNGNSSRSSIGNAGKVPNGTYYYIINIKDSGLPPFTGPVYIGTK